MQKLQKTVARLVYNQSGRLRPLSWRALVESKFMKTMVAGTYPGVIISSAQRQAAWAWSRFYRAG
jgi:hypothetical protein